MKLRALYDTSCLTETVNYLQYSLQCFVLIFRHLRLHSRLFFFFYLTSLLSPPPPTLSNTMVLTRLHFQNLDTNLDKMTESFEDKFKTKLNKKHEVIKKSSYRKSNTSKLLKMWKQLLHKRLQKLVRSTTFFKSHLICSLLWF